MIGLALDIRVDNGPGGTCLVRQSGPVRGGSSIEPAPISVAGAAMSLDGKEMGAPKAAATGGVLCRPLTAPMPHYMTNRGVSDPPTSAAGPFGPRPRRVAHAPIPCPVVAATRGPVRGRLSVHRGCPPDAYSNAGATRHMPVRDTKPRVFGRNEPWL